MFGAVWSNVPRLVAVIADHFSLLVTSALLTLVIVALSSIPRPAVVVAHGLGLVVLVSIGIGFAMHLSHCIDCSQLALRHKDAILLMDQVLGSVDVDLVLRFNDSVNGIILRW
jgi:hypothetical protein